MHIEGPQIYQINRQTNSFQNMCDMLSAKIYRLARKIDSLHLKKNSYFCVYAENCKGYVPTMQGNDRTKGPIKRD